MIPVTKPFLPPKEEYDSYLNQIWSRNWLTNNGPLVNELELSLKDFLNIKHVLYVSNGTIALQLAIKALDLKGEIITTPFSYVATTSSIVWEGCDPVYVDIDQNTLNINPDLIEEAITENTSAILATHVFGNPCEVWKIEAIAEKYNLKVIYDGAHCFGVDYQGRSLFSYGDICTASFHATKLFHTIEGGAVFTRTSEILERISFMRNFGHDGPSKFNGLGINGKNSEFHAAMGIVNLNFVDDIINKRKLLSDRYDQWIKQSCLIKPLWSDKATKNYAYYPVLFLTEKACLDAYNFLLKNGVSPRRYFYPCLNTLSYIEEKGETEVAFDMSSRILCLPLYYELNVGDVDRISNLLLSSLNKMK